MCLLLRRTSAYSAMGGGVYSPSRREGILSESESPAYRVLGNLKTRGSLAPRMISIYLKWSVTGPVEAFPLSRGFNSIPYRTTQNICNIPTYDMCGHGEGGIKQRVSTFGGARVVAALFPRS